MLRLPPVLVYIYLFINIPRLLANAQREREREKVEGGGHKRRINDGQRCGTPLTPRRGSPLSRYSVNRGAIDAAKKGYRRYPFCSITSLLFRTRQSSQGRLCLLVSSAVDSHSFNNSLLIQRLEIYGCRSYLMIKRCKYNFISLHTFIAQKLSRSWHSGTLTLSSRVLFLFFFFYFLFFSPLLFLYFIN